MILRMPTYRLIYFPGKGRAEVARMLLALLGTPYEDYRLKEGEWQTLKPSRLLLSLLS